MVNTEAPEVVTEIYPETFSQRKLPVNFLEDHRALFEPVLETVIPASHLIKLVNVRVSREGILFAGNRILPQSFAFPWQVEEWKTRSVFKLLATNHLLRRRRRIDEEIVWITDYWSTGYFHWLTDALTRLFVVQDRLQSHVLMLPAGYESRAVVTASLQAFGVKNVDFIGHNEVLDCRALLMPTHTAPSGHFRNEAIRGVRNVLLSALGDAQTAGDRIYISRKRADKRRIANENELTPILTSFGFQTIYAEELSFEEQVKICSRARYIVSNHGAGLTNAMFMQAGGRVLELRHLWDRNRNCYFIMASALNLNYFYQRCRPWAGDRTIWTSETDALDVPWLVRYRLD
jgi:capsular polysaccharide biosynthesis protein